MTEIRRTTADPGPSDFRRVTIRDVARDAGVSVSAVSKVVRDAPGVSPQMRSTVTAVIDRLGYRPHAGARAMRGRSFTVGVVLTEMSSPFQVEIVDGLGAGLEGTGFQEVVIAAGIEPRRQIARIQALLDRQVDGLVLIAPWIEHARLEQIAERIPLVAVARHGGAAHFDTIVDDDARGAELVVDHLVGLGHRRILHTGQSAGGLEFPHVLSHTARAAGYEAAMRKHGLQPEVIVTEYSEEGGHRAALQALDRPDRPTAVFAGADIAALGVLRAAEERGLRVPEDLSVAGYDNIFLSGTGRVALTTVDQSGRSTGLAAGRLLLERIGGRIAAERHVVGSDLVVRATTAAPHLWG